VCVYDDVDLQCLRQTMRLAHWSVCPSQVALMTWESVDLDNSVHRVCVCGVCVCGKGQDFPSVTSVPRETTAELQATKVSSNALPNNKKLLLLCWLLV